MDNIFKERLQTVLIEFGKMVRNYHIKLNEFGDKEFVFMKNKQLEKMSEKYLEDF